MKVSIQRVNDDPANTMLEVYYDNNSRPICHIWEEDFVELLTDKQFHLFEKGQFKFEVNKIALMDKSKHWSEFR
jgi:hypothetical protein